MAHLHIWYHVSTRYLSEKDIYNLVIAFPQFKNFKLCMKAYANYLDKNKCLCPVCSYRFPHPAHLFAHWITKHYNRYFQHEGCTDRESAENCHVIKIPPIRSQMTNQVTWYYTINKNFFPLHFSWFRDIE